MSLAPIILFTFNRLDHTMKTVEALKKNYRANESELIIFSDSWRNEEEKEIVQEVREYLKSIDGFKSIEIIEAKKNKGLANSVIEGVSKVINTYGKVIVLEDDLITSRFFLKYMNEALELYKDRNDIWSISGYTPNIEIPDNYKDEVYLTKRGASWGWATWKDRWLINDWDVLDYWEFKKDKSMKREFNKSGTDMCAMLNDQMENRINSWAIRWGYNQFKHNMWTVYPVKSYVKSIGNDLSGTHVPLTNKYDVKLNNNEIIINPKIKEDYTICNNFKKFYDLNISGYIAIVIKKIGLYKQVRSIRNRVIKRIIR